MRKTFPILAALARQLANMLTIGANSMADKAATENQCNKTMCSVAACDSSNIGVCSLAYLTTADRVQLQMEDSSWPSAMGCGISPTLR